MLDPYTILLLVSYLNIQIYVTIVLIVILLVMLGITKVKQLRVKCRSFLFLLTISIYLLISGNTVCLLYPTLVFRQILVYNMMS